MIDVSGFQHPGGAPIDWAKVKASGVEAVVMKATEGNYYRSPYFHSDYDEATRNGLYVGAYHFSRPGLTKPLVQSEYFRDWVGGRALQLGAVNDFESADGLSWRRLARWGREFHGRCREWCQAAPVYMDDDWLENLPEAPWGDRLWLALPGERPRREVWAWQFGTGTVDGISGPCDLDQLFGP
jgi:lysozyme